jgi:hypothetical protein
MRGLLVVGGFWWRWMPGQYVGMALLPFILLRRPDPPEQLLCHERIHLRQQMELLILPFYVWYLSEYALHRLRGRDHDTAYRSISFEREAFAHDHEADYLTGRPLWSFRKYLRP